MGLFKKKYYSKYKNPNANKNNRKSVKKGSVVVSELSNYEKLPKSVKDHKRESIVVLKDSNDELGVVFIHGKNNIDGKTRAKKKEAGLWEEIKKNGQEVYVDLDIRITDSKGNPIKQGRKFQNTGVIIEPEEMKKVEKHIYESNGRKSHSVRKILKINRDIQKGKKKSKAIK